MFCTFLVSIFMLMTVQSMFFTFCLSDIFYFDSAEHDLHIFSLLTMQGVFCTLSVLIFLLLIVQSMFCTILLWYFCYGQCRAWSAHFFSVNNAEHDLHTLSLLTMQSMFCTLFSLIFLKLIVQNMNWFLCVWQCKACSALSVFLIFFTLTVQSMIYTFFLCTQKFLMIKHTGWPKKKLYPPKYE